MIFVIPFFIAIFLTLNMGGSGTAPSFSAAYGAGIVKRSTIPLLFGIFVLLGAMIAGDKVIKTIGGAVLPSENMGVTIVSIVLLASALSIFFANLFKVPQSTSQSTVFALVGCAVALDVLESDKLLYEMIPTWFIMPIISFAITYFFGLLFYRVFKSFGKSDLAIIRKQSFWKFITLACSCYVAFSIGSNNIANSAGPLVSLAMNKFELGNDGLNISLIMVLIIAPWFGIGSAILGGGVIKTVGRGIVKIDVMEASLISVITASLLLLASITRGIPTSLVQMNTFSVIAIGLLKDGHHNIFSRIQLWRILTVWLIAPLFALLIGFIMTLISINLRIII